jgi:hypothetical protein
MGIARNTVRSHADDLKRILDCSTVEELGRFWRAHRSQWHAWIGTIAGLETS